MKSALLFISIVLFPFFVIAQDTIPPTPVLMDYRTVQLQGDSMSFPASFFNISSYDNQTDSSDLRFAYSEDVSDSIKTFYCHNKYNIDFEVFVFDSSGNYASEEIENKFESQNCPDTVDAIPPTPYCLNGIATFVDEHGVTIPANYFNAGSWDDQTPEDQLRYSYSEDINDTLRHFDCEDIGTTIAVSIYVHDLSGKSNYCSTYFQVADGEDCQSNTEVVDSEDTIPPRLFVLNGIATIKVPTVTNIVGVYAEDFVLKGFDDITNEEDLIYSFSLDTNDRINYYTCAHEGSHEIYIYAFDEAGNWSKVQTYLRISTLTGGECEYPDTDTIPPTISCTQDTLSFSLNEDSIVHVNISQIIDTIYDDYTEYDDIFLNYGGFFSNDVEEFGCDELGYHTFNFQASDLLLNSSTCEATIEIVDTLDICQTTAVEQKVKSKHIHIYPNPASDRMHVNAPIDGELHIIDALGRQMYAEEIRANVPVQLNVQSWNIGVYSAVLINQKGERISTLFIIQ